jgi:hypothetical protein
LFGKIQNEGGNKMKRLFGLVMGMMFLASCATTTPSKTGFLGEYSKNLTPGPEGGVKERWLKPGVDFTKYNKMILEHVIFFFADDSQYKGMDSSELHQIAEKFDLAIVTAVKDVTRFVTEPGPDVARIRIAITDLKQNSPTMGVISTATMVTPIGAGINLIRRGATGSWSGSGGMSAEFMVIDSMTNQVIAAARDERRAGFTERFTKWGSAEEAIKFWAERIKIAIQEIHGVKK